jgi:hypothetical protein
MRTSYYGKKHSEFYLEEEDSKDQAQELMLNVLGDLILLKKVFMSEVSTKLITEVLKISLNLKEAMISSCIVAYYTPKLSERMIERALKTDQMDFIQTIWAYHKNYSHESKKTMTFEYLFYTIKDLLQDNEANRKIKEIVYWKIKTTENMLKALLINNADEAAIKYTHLYLDDVNMDLLLFCLNNTNQEFLRKALKDNIFTGQHLNDFNFINNVIRIFRHGTRIDLVLNVLGYMEFTKWTQAQLKDFVSISQSIIYEKFESNIIVLASNAVLSI